LTRRPLKSAFTGMIAVCSILFAAAVQAADAIQPYVDAVAKTERGMTLWELIKSGGALMWVLAAMSILAVALVVFLFLTLKVSKVVPHDVAQDLIGRITARKYGEAKEVAAGNDSAIARIALAGLDRADKGALAIKEAVELTAKNEVTKLWDRLGYLQDICNMAPLVGLLGTILGMIQAFNAIVLNTMAVVKPIHLAGGVSKAMITTAAGLFIAIPAMAAYTFFRTRLVQITSEVETVSGQIVDHLAESSERTGVR